MLIEAETTHVCLIDSCMNVGIAANESTQRRLIAYTVAEYVMLLAASIGQVYLIQQLFSKRIGYNRV